MKYFSFGAEEETGVRYIHVKFQYTYKENGLKLTARNKNFKSI